MYMYMFLLMRDLYILTYLMQCKNHVYIMLSWPVMFLGMFFPRCVIELGFAKGLGLGIWGF
ncbi:hypothetical protein BDV36DRAFT_264494 [Aspergillus pseudocaelatus]|uniref:Uncharacterized protein n=1 Tax=Aspergillus pseudocaelatus TaxID=1825620 RepID=A0ABQ6WCE0_9EURO|nr:hypothetical protein BDV36DRAFT_264494 [Aspergillus pseudocaelatus]